LLNKLILVNLVAIVKNKKRGKASMLPINEHLISFAGKPVIVWEEASPLIETEVEQNNYKIGLFWDDCNGKQRWTDRFAALLADPLSPKVTGIIVGLWDEIVGEDISDPSYASRIVEALVAAREALPHLTAIFFGDIITEENQISWIGQCDMAPLLAAYPNLEHFCVRGSNNLSLGTNLHHDHLQTLIVQSGGLSRQITQQVTKAHLPQLQHLELWLGTSMYGGDTTVEDVKALLTEPLFPKLQYLGLCDSDIADEIAQTLQQLNPPLLEQLKVLDLSFGTLSDIGAAALLEIPAITKLESLNLSFHFCSEEMMTKLTTLAGVAVDVSLPQRTGNDSWEYRYVAVSE
jgi:hypothetical protein